MSVIGAANTKRGRGRLSLADRIVWSGMLVLAAFPLIGASADLVADRNGGGIPGDHTATFHALTGMTVAQAKVSAPGLVRYVHQLEVGYAIHELVFALLLLSIVAVPLRMRQRWAWLACWTVLLADITYAATFGAHDPTVLRGSLVGAIAMPVLLAAFAPACFRRSRQPDRRTVGSAPAELSAPAIGNG